MNLIKRIEKELHESSPTGTRIIKFEVDYGDKRSYGSFDIEAETAKGRLVGSGSIDSGGDTEDEAWTLNGEIVEGPEDLGIPHYYAGNRAITRFEKSKDEDAIAAIDEWLTSQG